MTWHASASGDSSANRLLYLNDILQTQTARDLTYAIEHFRTTLPATKSWVNLPV